METAAQRWGDREYVSFEGTRLTFAEFNTWVNLVAADLVAHGVVKGERVLTQLMNCLEAMVMQGAALRIGAVNVPVVPIYREHELQHIVADAAPAAILVGGRLNTRVPTAELDSVCANAGVRPKVRYVCGELPDGWRRFPESPQASTPPSHHQLPSPAAPADTAVILYTSGTTSLPKGAVLSSRSIYAQVEAWCARTTVNHHDVVLVGTPISHLAGFFMSIAMPSFVGARVIAMRSWNSSEAASLIACEGATIAAGASFFIRELVEIWKSGRYQGHRLGAYVSSGSSTDPDLVRVADSLGVRTTRTYGMTEAGVCTGSHPLDALELRANHDGRLLDNVEIEAVDEDRKTLPPGEIGELRVRGIQLMDQYTDPEATAAQLDSAGWFYTGDVGSVTNDGWVTMSGRIKEIINRGGEKFSSQDIEAALCEHPDVHEAAVVGLPDPTFGEKVAAFVVLASGATWGGPDGLIAHLNSKKLARAKIPVDWFTVAALPRNPTGKIQKFKLATTTMGSDSPSPSRT